MKQFRKHKKRIAFFLLVLFCVQFAPPAFALTGGPSQPEVQSFAPVATSDMVDLFSGDFNYNLPLMDVGGYPLNLIYNAGITTDQEASWVGLGWNVNPGVINRNMRSLPDDFNGDVVDREFNMKDMVDVGIFGGVGLELAGLDDKAIGLSLNASLGINYNNYRGYRAEVSIGPNVRLGKKNGSSLNIGLSFTGSTENGAGINPNVSFSSSSKDKTTQNSVSVNIGASINTREGFQGMTTGYSISKSTYEGKKTTGRGSVGNSSSISFVSQPFTPSLGNDNVNVSGSIALNMGFEGTVLHPNANIRSSYSRQFIPIKNKGSFSSGYMYMSNNQSGLTLTDYGREKDESFQPTASHLPVGNLNYDIFSASGQGVSGMYRPYRSDVGLNYDPKQLNLNVDAANLGIELGFGNAAHSGIDIRASVAISQSGGDFLEEFDNQIKDNLKFRNSGDDPFYESYYFKQVGELAAETDMDHFEKLGGFEPISIKLNQQSFTRDINKSNNSTQISSSGLYRKKRQNRNQDISVLSAEDASAAGIVKNIPIFDFNTTTGYTLTTGNQVKFKTYVPSTSENRINSFRKPHHISELSILRNDGTRYYYGIPAYNLRQEETSFAVSSTVDCGRGTVSYRSGNEDSPNNQSGNDGFYERNTTYGYAHSYLLTAIVSPDYVDVDGIDGPSDGDLGTYTKFNYGRVYGQSNPYKWRTPYEREKANFNEGLKSLSGSKSDDKGNYVYGEKEIWYVHSIETKTHVAEFYISNREDGYGTLDKAGGFNSAAPLKKLDKIVLFSKQDKIANGSAAKPLKVAHFEYDYSLCAPSIGAENALPNNEKRQASEIGNDGKRGGKLSLKRVYFTYENSFKGRLSPYSFSYSEINPPYNQKSYDRWGNYKQYNNTGCQDGLSPDLSEFPYVEQNKTNADNNAKAWNLNQITLPSGGKINVTYESDDYAFVQNKGAMQMVTISGVGNSASGTPQNTNSLYGSSNPSDVNDYIYFKLPEPVDKLDNVSSSNELFKKMYVRDIENLYFRFFTQVNTDDTPGKIYEYVPGYCQIESYGVSTHPTAEANGKYIYGYLKLKRVSYGKGDKKGTINPITRAGWQFAQIYNPKLINPGSGLPEPGGNELDFIALVKAVIGAIASFEEIDLGPNGVMFKRGCSKNYIGSKSWIRLYSPTYKKLGGGHRVKKVQINDAWAEMVANQSNSSFQYGQEYEYTKQETIDGRSLTISSGVASYEPLVGGEENPWRQPVFYDSPDNALAPSKQYFGETPYGESYFPSPSVGYSQVTVKNLSYANVKSNATGKVVHSFYTSREYPTKVKHIEIQKNAFKPALGGFLKVYDVNYMAASQGYVVELNDMHGKPKGQQVFAESDGANAISSVEYKYKEQSAGQLSNLVDVIQRSSTTNNLIKKAQVGVDYDVFGDIREADTKYVGGGVQINIDLFFASVLPVGVPSFWPDISFSHTRFRSGVITKVINRFGVLEETIAKDVGASASTKNLLYDAETGQVLLTRTTNAYNDSLYQFTYPAHWAYDGMGLSSKNNGLELSGSLSSYTSPNLYFSKGDELLLRTASSTTLGWVGTVTGSQIMVIDKNGAAIDNSTSYDRIKIVRSGRRNMASTPIGSITMLKSPLIDSNRDGTYDGINFQRVLQASATEFTDNWKTFCDCGIQPDGVNNPFLLGTQGNYKAKKSYLYLTERTQSNKNGNVDTRRDGIFKQFTPFWRPPLSNQTYWTPDANLWTWTSEVTLFSPYGYDLENKDRLGRYSAALYGYNNTMPTAVSNNSQYKEVAFDNFEDYDVSGCDDDHFSYKTEKLKVDKTQAHSGKRSIKVGPNAKVEIKKVIVPCQE